MPIAISVVLGLLAGASSVAPWGAWAALGLVCAATAGGSRRCSRIGTACVLGLWCGVGALRLAVWQAQPGHALAAQLPEDAQPVQAHGRVLEEPAALLTGPAWRDEEWHATTLQLFHVRDAAAWRAQPGRLRLVIAAPRVPLAVGDDVLLEGRWQRTPPAGNPGEYDRRAAGARRGIYGALRVGPADGLVVLRPGHPSLGARAVSWLRHRWEALLTRAFDEPQTGLWRSLLLGQRVALEETLERAFIETGTIHLLVVSGFNVGLVALLLEWGLRLLGLPLRARLALSAAALGAYTAVTGAQPPVVRATVMAWLVLGALALDRVVRWPNLWAAALLALLLYHPAQLWDPSFQLSFGAVACLIGLSPGIVAWLTARLKSVRPPWLARYVALNVGATLAVSIGLAPVLAWYFFLFTPIALVGNLLLVPLFSALIAGGTGALILATAWPALLLGVRDLMSWGLEATLALVRFCQAWPGGHIVVGQPAPRWLVGYYVLLAVTCVGRSLRWPAPRLLLAWLGGAVLWIGAWAARPWLERPLLRVDVLDVGHGDSMLVRLPAGHALLVDAGTDEAARTRVVPFLRHQGLRRLDALMLTHPDADHIGGAATVLAQVPVGALLTNGVEDDTMAARAVRAEARRQGLAARPLAARMRLSGDPAVRVDVLHPPRGLVPGVPPPSNDNSVVLKITMGAVSILLTGDLEEAGLPHLLTSGQGLQATVLKVPHHGSRLGAAGEAFFARVHPCWALLSVGRLHHLPAEATLAALTEAGASVLSTRERGMLSLRTDGRRVRLTTFR